MNFRDFSLPTRNSVWCVIGLFALLTCSRAEEQDPFAWLEERDSPQVREWIQRQNDKTLQALRSTTTFAELGTRLGELRDIEDDTVKFGVGVALVDGWIYRFHKSHSQPRGLWQRARHDTGAPKWETLLDLDKLAKDEETPWMFGPSSLRFSPNGRNCMIALVRGNSDLTATWREFSLDDHRFRADGFIIPEDRNTSAHWKDDDTLVISRGTPDPGHPHEILEWRRGEKISSARCVFRETNTIRLLPTRWETGDGAPIIGIASVEKTRELRYWVADRHGGFRAIFLPTDARILDFSDGRWLLMLRKPWNDGKTSWPTGSVVALPVNETTGEGIVVPTERESVESVIPMKGGLLVCGYRNVVGYLHFYRRHGTQWTRYEIALPGKGIAKVLADDRLRWALASYEDFITPRSNLLVDCDNLAANPLVSAPQQFRASGLAVEQFEVASTDGTKIPYFLVRRSDLPFDGSTPTLLTGYGANGIPLLPKYDPVLGKLWLERGGAFALANIRGGGEFGPAWHQAALKQNKQKSYDDFHAVARDLIERKVTSAKRLGIYGHSNGGLVMAVAIRQHPETFSASIMSAGVLDTIRTDLMSSTSVEAERGSPTIPAERAFLDETSPYQNLRAGLKLPTPLIVTARTDEVVHPAMSRKYAAKMEALGLPYYFYEFAEGGHSVAELPRDKALLSQLEYTYLSERLGLR
jgi:prolyl oligopeptidase